MTCHPLLDILKLDAEAVALCFLLVAAISVVQAVWRLK